SRAVGRDDRAIVPVGLGGRCVGCRLPAICVAVGPAGMSVLELVWQWFRDPAHWHGPDGIPTRLVEHLQLSGESVLLGALIALPLGIALGHYGRFGNLAINISNVGRALP